MPKQREAVPEEIAALADELRNLWRAGQRLRPWLRKHRQMILGLVHDEWSWDIMAIAFSLAKIKYRSGRGKDWSGEGLRREFFRAALPLKRDKNQENLIDSAPATRSNQIVNANQSPALARKQAMPEMPPVPSPTVAPIPRFKPVSLRPAEPRRMPSPEELAEIEQNRRLTFGRS